MPYMRRGAAFRRGLGIYPSSPCFDPTRPSWLPYWLDTLSESGCKYQLYPGVTTLATPPTPPALPAPAAPQTQEQMTIPGAWTPDMSQIATQQAAQEQAANFLQNVVTAPTNTCGGNTGDWTQATWSDTTTWCMGNWLVAGGAVVGVLLLLARMKH